MHRRWQVMNFDSDVLLKKMLGPNGIASLDVPTRSGAVHGKVKPRGSIPNLKSWVIRQVHIWHGGLAPSSPCVTWDVKVCISSHVQDLVVGSWCPDLWSCSWSWGWWVVLMAPIRASFFTSETLILQARALWPADKYMLLICFPKSIPEIAISISGTPWNSTWQ